MDNDSEEAKQKAIPQSFGEYRQLLYKKLQIAQQQVPLAKGTAPLDYYHNFGARDRLKEEAPERTTDDILNEIKRIPLMEDKLKYLAEEIIQRDKDIVFLQRCNENAVSKLATESLIRRTLQQNIIELQNSVWKRLKFLVHP